MLTSYLHYASWCHGIFEQGVRSGRDNQWLGILYTVRCSLLPAVKIIWKFNLTSVLRWWLAVQEFKVLFFCD